MIKITVRLNTKKQASQRLIILCIGLAFLFLAGCVATGTVLKMDLAKDHNIKFLKAYREMTAEKWQKTDIAVQKGDAVVIVPLYPKGFIYPVQGKIGETGKPFDGLDVDIGDICTAQQDGILYIGMDQKAGSVQTGVFIFKNGDRDSLMADFEYIQKSNKDAKVINLALGLLLKKRADRMIAQNKPVEALPVLDKSIGYLEQADEKLYSRTIYQIYREKAVIFKNNQDMAKYDDSIKKSFDSLIMASEYYRELKSRRFAFLNQLTPEERFILVSKTSYFEDIKAKDSSSQRGRYYWHEAMPVENLAYPYLLLCRYYTFRGDLRLSIVYADKSIVEAKKIGDKALISSSYNELGIRHRYFGNIKESEDCFNKALIYASTNWIVRLYPAMSLAVLNTDLGQYEKAEELMQSIYIPPPERAQRLNMVLNSVRAYIYTKKNDNKNAIFIMNNNLPEYKFIKNQLMTGHGETTLAMFVATLSSYAEAGTINESNEVFEAIGEDIESLGNPPNLKLIYSLALSKFNKRVGKDAIAPLLDAITALEVIRPTAGTGKDYEYWENMLKVYDMTIASLYNKEKYLDALNTVEKARSRRFLDDLGNKKLGAKGVASLMTQRANETLDALAMLEADMMEAAQKAGIKVRSVYDKDSRLGKKMENYKATLKQASDSDQQFGVVASVVPISVEKLQKLIPADTTVVEYYKSEKDLYIWVIDNHNISAVRQDISKERLRRLIEQYRKSLYQESTQRGVIMVEKDTADFAALQREAYRLLIAPVEKSIKTKKICIVPYDILNYLPFQSLHDGRSYLVEKYALSYLPSLSVLEYLRKAQKKDHYTILAIGNPDLGDEKKDLPAAGVEVDMIKEIFPQAVVYKRKEATKATVKREAHQYDILHFAAHGEYKADDALSSCLYLAPSAGENGQLQVDEIFDMSINAEMVVTSACQTALGKISRGDEVLGLTRAFMYAGANSVFGSLWSISDEATSVLMKDFYTNIKTLEMSEALRRAQMKMIRSKEYNHPFYWAAFNITGAL